MEGTLLVPAADKLYNSRAILEDYRELGAEVWKRFKRGRDQQLWYFEELLKIYEARCPNWRIIKELKHVVAELAMVSEAVKPSSWSAMCTLRARPDAELQSSRINELRPAWNHALTGRSTDEITVKRY